jgi:hypothetical protein
VFVENVVKELYNLWEGVKYENINVDKSEVEKS